MRALTSTMKVGIPGPEGSIAKLQWSSTNQALTELAVEIGGIEALAKDSPWAYRFLRSRANSIEGGTTDVLTQHRRRAGARPAEAEVGRRWTSTSTTSSARSSRPRATSSPAASSPRRCASSPSPTAPTTTRSGSEICELGWPGIAIAEEYGGQGLGAVELVILQEELGYACAPVADDLQRLRRARVIEAAGSDEQRSRWLPGIASGEARGAAELTCDPDPVVGAAEGAVVLVLADGGGREARRDRATATLERLDLIDTTRAYFRVSAEGGDPLPGDIAPRSTAAPVALAAELVGVAQRALDMAVDYAKEREQFGRPIGAYQAVSHRLADMLWEVEEARSLTYYAAWAADAEPETLPLAASMAKARASDAACVGHPRRDPDPRRDRLHLGARRPLPAQAGPGRRRADGQRGASTASGSPTLTGLAAAEPAAA